MNNSKEIKNYCEEVLKELDELVIELNERVARIARFTKEIMRLADVT